MSTASMDYEISAVPGNQKTSGVKLALIIVGGSIGFAVFIVAAQIGGSLGYAGAGAAFALGSLILGIMGATTSYVGAKSRLSTYLLTEFAFGRIGAKIANLTVALSLVGWYGVINNTLGQAAHSMLLDSFGINVPVYFAILVASSLMISVTVMGFTGIDRLALILVPVMVGFIFWAASLAWQQNVPNQIFNANGFTFQTAVSAVVGSYIAGVIIQPDYSRFAKNVSHAVWGVFIALAIGFPLVQFFSALPSMAMGIPDIIQVMLALGILLPAFFLLLLGAWSSNVLCLYSSSLSLATMTKRLKLSTLIIGLGVVGSVLALMPVQSYLIGFLVLLGITIPPIGAIYVIEAIVLRRFAMELKLLDREKPIHWPAFFAWATALIFGYLSTQGIVGIVWIASIDSLIVSAAVYLLVSVDRIRKRQLAT